MKQTLIIESAATFADMLQEMKKQTSLLNDIKVFLSTRH
jgi:hypothetical protein